MVASRREEERGKFHTDFRILPLIVLTKGEQELFPTQKEGKLSRI